MPYLEGNDQNKNLTIYHLSKIPKEYRKGGVLLAAIWTNGCFITNKRYCLEALNNSPMWLALNKPHWWKVMTLI